MDVQPRGNIKQHLRRSHLKRGIDRTVAPRGRLELIHDELMDSAIQRIPGVRAPRVSHYMLRDNKVRIHAYRRDANAD